MMGRIEKIIAVAILLALAGLIALIIRQSVSPEAEERIYSISVLADDLHEYTRRGMDRAALEYNVDVHYISGFGESAEEQLAYLQREISNGVDALILRAADADAVSGWLADTHASVRVVTIGDALPSIENAAYIAPDNIALGRMLGEQILAETPSSLPCLVLLEEAQQTHIAERCEGFTAAFDAAGRPVECRYLPAGEAPIAHTLERRPRTVVAVLDETLLAPLCAQARSYDRLFGIGYVSEVRTQLEEGRLEALAIYSAFDEGYMSMRQAVEAARIQAPASVTLAGMTVDADNMYKTPQAQALFPIS